MSRRDPRVRWIWLAIALFIVFILASSTASNRHERVLIGALPMALALLCAGRAWWLYGEAVIERRSFTWRTRTYCGAQAARFGHAMRAAGVAFAVLGLWAAAVWVWELGS